MAKSFKKYRVTANMGVTMMVGTVVRGLSKAMRDRYHRFLVADGEGKTEVTVARQCTFKHGTIMQLSDPPKMMLASLAVVEPDAKAGGKAPPQAKPKGKASDQAADTGGDVNPNGSDGGGNPAAGDGTDTGSVA